MAGQVYTILGIGSNIGDRLANLRAAVSEFHDPPRACIMKASSVYETEPVGFEEQGWFLNAVIEAMWAGREAELSTYWRFRIRNPLKN